MVTKLNYDIRSEDGGIIFLPPCPREDQVNLGEPDVHAESKKQLYPIGALLWYPGLGMKYRYAKAGDILVHPRQLLYNGNLVPDASGHVNEDGFYGHAQVDGADVGLLAGVTEISITDTIDRVKDYFAGGYLIAWDRTETVFERSYIISGPAAPTVTPWQNTILKLQHPKKYAIVSGWDLEVWLNPYGNIVEADDVGSGGTTRQFQTAMGVAEIPIQTDYYFWLQTAGSVFVVPNGWGVNCPGYAANKREVYPTINGAIITPTGAALQGDQRIGVIMSRTPGNDADAWVNLDLDLGH